MDSVHGFEWRFWWCISWQSSQKSFIIERALAFERMDAAHGSCWVVVSQGDDRIGL